MGTRSLTFVYDDNGSVIINMYRQMDGYPSGHGAELAEFLTPIQMVNGLGTDKSVAIANGMPCLAAQLVAHFKDGPGGIYLEPPSAKDCMQDYEYHITRDGGGLNVACKEITNYDPIRRKAVYKGTVAEFAKFCKEGDK